MSEELNKATYPGVELAYPLAASSYDVALKRFDAMDGRLQTILAFIVATSAAVPALAAGRIHFQSCPDWEFKMDFINQAANDFEVNATIIERKWRCTLAITLLFFVQTALLAAWVLDSF
jgi:hypothetical protein